MKRIEWDLMRPQDIEIRPAQIKDGKATLLCYQDSRNTMDALDRNFGEFGWKIEYKDVAGQIYGRLSIKDPDTGEWISKEDTGEESNISAQKGMSSDILKRCAVRFGYGRELYSAPRIEIPDDGYGCRGYKVTKIEYNEDRNITFLAISNRYGKTVFTWSVTDGDSVPAPTPIISPYDALKSYCGSIKATVDKEQLKKFWAYYEPKAKVWKGNINPEQLWKKWTAS